MKKIKNIGKGLIVLNYMDKNKTRQTKQLGAGESVESDEITQNDVQTYIASKKIEFEDVKQTKKNVEAITLPENPTVEILKSTFTVKQLRKYCKDNNIAVATGLAEVDIIVLILDSLEKKV